MNNGFTPLFIPSLAPSSFVSVQSFNPALINKWITKKDEIKVMDGGLGTGQVEGKGHGSRGKGEKREIE